MEEKEKKSQKKKNYTYRLNPQSKAKQHSNARKKNSEIVHGVWTPYKEGNKRSNGEKENGRLGFELSMHPSNAQRFENLNFALGFKLSVHHFNAQRIENLPQAWAFERQE